MVLLYPINLTIQPTDSLETLYTYIEQIEELIFNKLRKDEPVDVLENEPEPITIEDIFDEDFLLDMEQEIYCQIDEYEIKNVFHIDEPLKNKITETITTNILLSIEHIYENGGDNNDDSNNGDDDDDLDYLNEIEITEFVKERVDIYFTYVYPNIHPSPQIPKSIKIDEFDNYQPTKTPHEIALLQQQIDYLKSHPQPEQRTTEWYEFRNGIMTASNIYKLLGTQAQYNSFICEKCNPVIPNKQSYINTTDSRHWGQKYEKLSIQIYEKLYDTKVSEFGCIRHPTYEYIGASPDGIVTAGAGGKHNHFGRMIEIKNIVNREITGIPLEAYWVQMQIQMEVCNLDICNFIETRFKECRTTEEWKTIKKTKGVAITNIPILSVEYVTPEYEFIIYENGNGCTDDTQTFIDKWSSKKVVVNWWYMDEFSCVAVPRNRGWFNSVLPRLTEAWNVILREKETGEYKQRLPKKKQANPKCLIQFDNTSVDKTYKMGTIEDKDNEFIGKKNEELYSDETVKSFYFGNEKTGLNRNTVVVKDI
jgi:putative phage-type endonuclease